MPPLPNDRKPPSKPPKKRPLNVEDGAEVEGEATEIWIAACKKLRMSLHDYLWHPRFNDVLPVEVTVVLPKEADKENGDPHNDKENGDPHNDEEERRLDKLAEERRLDELAEERRLEKLAEERRRVKLAEEEEMFQGLFDDLVNQGTLSRNQGTSAANAEDHRSSIHIPVDNPVSVNMPGQSIEKPILSDRLDVWFFSSADALGMQAAISIDAGASTTAGMPGQPIEKADPNFAMDDEMKQRFSDNIGTSSGADPEERSDNVDVSLGFSDPRVGRIYRYVRDVGLCYLRRLRSLSMVHFELELTRYEMKANEVWGGFLQNSLQVQELFRAQDVVEFQKDLERTCQGTCTLIRRFRQRWDACAMRYRVLEDVEDCLKHGRGNLSELIRGKHNAKNMVTDLKSAAMALMDCLKVIWELYDLLKVIEIRRHFLSQVKRKSVIRRG